VTLSLRTIQGTTAGVAQEPVTLPLALPGLHQFGSRLPIKAGETIGVTSRVTNFGTESAGSPIISTVSGVGVFGRVEGPFVQGSTTPFTIDPDREILVNADVEPDADHDGFGDETQDLCPRDTGTHLVACPASSGPSDTTPPTTKLTYKPRQDFLASRKIVVYIRSNESSKAVASGQLEIGSGRHKGRIIYGLNGVSRQIKAKAKKKLRLTLPKKTWEAAERAIGNGKQTLVKVTVSAIDAAGNESGRTVAVIRPQLA
jgi:hypothetical protein